MFFIAQAQAQSTGGAPAGGAGVMNIVLMVGIFAVMWFIMIRPQQKRAKEHREMVASLKKGDEVMTNAGIMGRIVALSDNEVDLEVSKGIVLRFQRQFVLQVLPKGSLKGELVEASASTPKEEE